VNTFSSSAVCISASDRLVGCYEQHGVDSRVCRRDEQMIHANCPPSSVQHDRVDGFRDDLRADQADEKREKEEKKAAKNKK